MPCQDLACQLAKHNLDINVMIGGGQRNFYPTTADLPAAPGTKGRREDGEDLVKYWRDQQTAKGRKFCYISKPGELDACDAATNDYILGKL